MLSTWKRIMRRLDGISLKECDLIGGLLVFFGFLECMPLAMKCIPHVYEACEDTYPNE